MRLRKVPMVVGLVVALFAGRSQANAINTIEVAEGRLTDGEESVDAVLSPIWSASIRRWSAEIDIESRASGLDPDLIAAVINAESNGREDVISYAGAVGLMGIMPASPGLEWRPEAEALTDPSLNISWGVSILAAIVRQSGGDIYAALAAYSGGWDQVNKGVPQDYAACVLNDYGRAVAARSGVSPDIASQWTLALEIRRGHVPAEPLLILGAQPLSGLRTYGEHVVYDSIDEAGRAFYVKGFAIPLALVVPPESEGFAFGSGDAMAPQLLARLGLVEMKRSPSDSRVLLACLPSLSRLRGRASTRWFAPSYCPSWHR